jgi:voltage-gated potassium channel Kch
MSTPNTAEQPLAPPRPLVRGWRRANSWWHRHLPFPPWLALIVITLGLGIWGFTQIQSAPGSHPIHHLDAYQSIFNSIGLLFLSLGPANSLGEHVNYPLIAASVLGASLTLRALLALTRNRIRRWYMRNRLHGHVVIAGAGALGTRLADELAADHDVILIDLDEHAAGLAPDPDRFVWAIHGDAARPATLAGAGIDQAAELYALTSDDYVNSQIVTAAQHAETRARVRVRIEDPGLTRFFEERSSVPAGAPDFGPATHVTPFSTNAVAARALLVDEQPIGDWHERPGPLLAVTDGAAPHILLAGDHSFLDAVVLESLRRWRSLALPVAGALPPLRISIYGPGAVERVEQLRNRWRPEPDLLEIYCRDLPSGGQGAIESDDWLRRLRGGRGRRGQVGELVSHAIVACDSELDGVALALAVGRALGDGVPLLRVSMLGSGELDERIHERTRASRVRATTSVTSIPDLVCRAAAIRSHAALEDRLFDELVRRGASPESARYAIAQLMANEALEIHSDPAWRFSAREIPMLRALLDDDGVSLEAFVAAGLALDLGAPATLERCAERLLRTDTGSELSTAWRARLPGHELHAAAFAACCEFARATSDPDVLRRFREAVEDDGVRRLFELREYVLSGHGQAQADLLREAEPKRFAGFDRVAIFAGAGGASPALTDGALATLAQLLGPPEARRALGRLSPRGEADGLLPETERFQALRGFDGVVLGGGTDGGVSGVVARAAAAYGVPLIGYVPAGAGDRALYSQLRETDGSDFSELEPLAMWADILAASIPPARVTLIATPGGPVTRAEILIARALGARVGFVDPEGESPLALDDDLPGGAEDVIQLPPDAMSIRALICWTELEDRELRDHVARLTHAEYRSKQPAERLDRDPACAPWDRLLPVFRASNRDQADDIANKLAMLGLRVARVQDGGRPLGLTEKEVQLLAEMEHGRYVVDRLRAGWQLGDRDANRGRSPYFVPWTELTVAERYWDVSAVETIPGALQSFGYGVTEIEHSG